MSRQRGLKGLSPLPVETQRDLLDSERGCLSRSLQQWTVRLLFAVGQQDLFIGVEVGSDSRMNEGDKRMTDLSRLVQHVALNTSGWWEQAVERLVLICAYTLGPSSTADIHASVTD